MPVDKESFMAVFDAANKIEETNEEEVKRKSVAILVQHTPDPDCMGAAAGMAVILKELWDLQVDIFHYGEISHPQNKSMKNILHIQLNPAKKFDPVNHCATMVLDTDLKSTGFATEDFTKVDVRLDHHSIEGNEETTYQDVRAVGATCSIVWDYMRTFEIDLSKHKNACTAMVLGIKTDTLDFTSKATKELDMEAYRNLLPYVDKEALLKVSRFPLPKQVFENEIVAYEKKRVKGTVLTSFIGKVSPHDRDSIATIADRFIRMEGINTVVIMAVVDNDLHASIRSDDSRVEVKDLIDNVFKGCGGRRENESVAGARLPLGTAFTMIKDDNTRTSVMDEIITNISEDIFDTLGVQE